MPGLLRGIARVAVASGTATAVSNRVSRRQAERWAGQGTPAYMAQTGGPPEEVEMAPPPRDPVEQLRELGELHQQGILTDEEFAAQKAKLLG